MKHLATLIVLALWCTTCLGQVNPFNSSRGNVGGNDGGAFNRGRAGNFNDYRDKLNAQYVSQTRQTWGGFNQFRGLVAPDRDDVPVTPVVMSEEEAQRGGGGGQRINIQGSVTPTINDGNRTQPIAPINEVPETNPRQLSFTFLGTNLQVRLPSGSALHLAAVGEDAVAEAWATMCDKRFNNIIVDCLRLRTSLKLCDWAYLLMLQNVGNAYAGNGTNEAVLLTAYIYSQSGYKMRLGEAGGKLYLLYASRHKLYNTPYFEQDGEQFYPLGKIEGRIRLCAAKYPKEQSLSLWVADNPATTYTPSPQRTLTSKRYPTMSVQTSVNKNLMDFYSSYPSSEVGGNFMTRWAMYARTPICKETRETLYPQLQRHLQGLSPLEATERLLNWVQTAFVYEYDDKVWGGDRAFFPDETLYYPYCDCEDRSIFFTRLVRDLLGLKCILIYYPGHLAAAVCFAENVPGDYIETAGKRFTICDPTYIGAPVGRTMPNMDNSGAKVIVLE